MNSVPAPWVRTRLRTAPVAALALALLVAVTACLAAALPRAVDRYEDAGLRRSVDRARPQATNVAVFAEPPSAYLSPQRRELALSPGRLGMQYAGLLRAVPRPLVADRAQSTYGVRTAVPLQVPDLWLPRPSGLPAQFSLAAQQGVGAHAEKVTGRLPRATAPVTAQTRDVEAAVTAETAKSLRIKVGSVIHVPGERRLALAVHITGIVTPREPQGPYWASQPLLRTPSLNRVPGGGADAAQYWLGALLLAPEAAPALLGTPSAAWRYWQLAPADLHLHAYQVDRLRSAVASLESGPALRQVRALTDMSATVNTGFDDILGSFTGLRDGVRPLVAVAAFGTGTVAVVVLLMADGLAADRRRAELTLLRARGASLPGLAARLSAETAVVAVPAGALGLAIALLALPHARTGQAVASAAAVTLLACLTLPLRAVATHHAVRIHAGRGDVTSVRPSRRRTVAELTLLVVTLGAVETLRRQGTDGDQLAALAPVLVGVAAALLLVRLYPLPLRALSRPAARLRGTVAHLSLARAARTSASTALPLLALLTALTTAAFGGSVLAGVHATRDRAALLTVGADARVEAATGALPTALPDRVRRTPGVRGTAAVSIEYQAKPGDQSTSVPLVGVDPRGYAELASRTGLGVFGGGELTGRSADGTVPAVASPSVASRYGTRPLAVRLEDGGTITVRITAVRSRTPAVIGDDFLVVNRTALTPATRRPTALLLTGSHLDVPALRRAVGTSAPLQLRSAERARYADSPLQSGAEHVYTAAVAAGAGYAVLSLLLTLLRTSPERTALLARLRTMGLPRSAGRRLLVLESLPQAGLAALGGTLTGWATIRLLSPGLDLTTVAVAGHQAPVGDAALRTDVFSLVLPAVTIVLVTVGVAGVQAWWTGRRGTVGELRAGDAR
ncbi:ABC transporter permease [Streptomyces sp. NPDC005799]|uniref:ABC transporter permease n=1 Tax=Streptomyces sp. NPDC005799 TaxID=3154678 RepID=UPI0033E38993